MTQIQKHGPAAPRTRRALHGLVITLIMIGIGAGATYAIFGGVIDNLGAMTDTNRVVIESVNMYTAGDRIVITGNLKNLGSTAMASVLIDEISAGSLVITQNAHIDDGEVGADHGDLRLVGIDGAGGAFNGNCGNLGADISGAVASSTTDSVAGAFNVKNGQAVGDACRGPTTAVKVGAVVEFTGLSMSNTELAALPAGASQAFRIVITGDRSGSGSVAGVLDTVATVPAGSDLFITIAGTDGQTSTISDVRTSKVKAR